MTPRPNTPALVSVLVAAFACALLLWPGYLRDSTRYVIVAGRSMEPALHTGDVVMTARRRNYETGDVIAYRIPRGEPGAGVVVIHRIIGGSANAGYLTQGDNRQGRDPWRPRPQDIIGSEVFSVPRVGLALAHIRTPLGLAALAGLLTALLILGGSQVSSSRAESRRAGGSAPRSSGSRRLL